MHPDAFSFFDFALLFFSLCVRLFFFFHATRKQWRHRNDSPLEVTGASLIATMSHRTAVSALAISSFLGAVMLGVTFSVRTQLRKDIDEN